MDSTPSSGDSEGVNLRAASTLSEFYYDAIDVQRSESEVEAATQDSCSSVAQSNDKSVALSSDKSEMEKSSEGSGLMSDEELEQRLWHQHVDLMI